MPSRDELPAIFASFNYYGPSVTATLVALGFALVVVILLGFYSRRILVGLFGGATIAAGIAALLIGTGQGDMVILILLFCTPIAAACGALIGGIAGYVGRRVAASTKG